MLLAIDVGNSNIVFALMKGEDIVHSWRTETHAEINATTFSLGFENAGLNPDVLIGGVLGSVVPNVNEKLETVFKALTGKDLLVVKGDGTDTGLVLDLDTPVSIGADRVLNIIAGKHYYGSPLVIIDFGTATTYDVVDENGAFIGGAIGAGIGISLKALHSETAQLPLIEFGEPPSVIGKNAKDALQSAAFFGALGALEGMVERIRAGLGEKATTLATGGFSGHFKGKTKAIDHFVPNLTLQGLRIVFERKNS
ncbi:MAG: type III pantothenate kinase [Sphingomonadales bacterium]